MSINSLSFLPSILPSLLSTSQSPFLSLYSLLLDSIYSSLFRALIGNVITPQDIGVTYDMIGGLAEVRALCGHMTHFMMLSPVMLHTTLFYCPTGAFCYIDILPLDLKVLLYTPPFNSSHTLLSSLLMILVLIISSFNIVSSSHHITLYDMASHSHR